MSPELSADSVATALAYWRSRAQRLEGRLVIREKIHKQNDVTNQRLGEARKQIKELEAEVARLTALVNRWVPHNER